MNDEYTPKKLKYFSPSAPASAVDRAMRMGLVDKRQDDPSLQIDLKFLGLLNYAGYGKANGGRIGFEMGGMGEVGMMGEVDRQLVEVIQAMDDPDKKVNASIMLLMKMGEDAIPLLKEALTELEFGAMAAKLDEMPDEEIGGGIASLEQGNMMGARQMASMDDDDDILDPDAMQTDPQELMREIQSQGAVQTARAPSQEGIMSMMRG